MQSNDPLQAFFDAEAQHAESAVPASDFGFKAGVMERVARKRLRLEFLARTLIGLALTLALWLSLPALAHALASSATQMAMVAASLVTTGLVAVLGHSWIRSGAAMPRVLGR